jgi:opacity protein-like surface antigen
MRKYLFAATAASMLSTAASAADLPIAQPPAYAPPPAFDTSGWYLRGDIGFSNQSVRGLSINDPALNAGIVPGSLSQTTAFDSAGIFDIGVGYRFNNWFRADVTGQYRGKANFKGMDLFNTPVGGGPVTPVVDSYSGSKSELLFLANAYVDLGTWWNVTPFVGAGIGTSRVTISNFADAGLIDPAFGGPAVAYALTGSQWNFAWAAHAGLAYNVTPGLTLELGYSYVDLGDGTTGRSARFDAPLTPFVFKFDHITSHDLKLGVRWDLNTMPVYAPAPLITKG